MFKILFVLLFSILYINTFSQSTFITFKKQSDTLRRSANDLIVPITMTVGVDSIPDLEKEKYVVTAKVDEDKTTISRSEYNLNFNSVSYNKVSKEYTFYLTVKKDEEVDRDWYIYVVIEITKDGKQVAVNRATSSILYTAVIKGSHELNSYNYLAYVGTNFDLVDGVQAKNLFFATNLFQAPVAKKGMGFNLTLYGNRTTTSTDTSGRLTYMSKAVPIGGDTARFYSESGLKTVSRVSDNLGATFSPLFRMGRLSRTENVVQIYYAPQLEFIWRRTTITTAYTDTRLVDSVDRPNRPFSGPVILTEPLIKTPLNVYDVYMGLAGLMMVHENKFVSVRVQGAFGWNFRYTSGRGSGGTRADQLSVYYSRKSQPFLFARAWITEPVSGLTFGAEVSNNLFKIENAQPYYNVTLSKAINLSSLAGLFKPIVTR